MPEVVFSKPSLFDHFGPTVFSLLSVLLAIMVIVGLWIWAKRQQQTTSRDLLSFGKPRARMFTGDKPTVTFDDIGGIEEAKKAVAETVEFFREPERFIHIGAHIPAGVLLSGPPGCGKTLLAKAVSGEAGVPFFSISASEFIEASMGIGAARVRDLFDQAKRNSPCIVFIDHLDSVGFKKEMSISSAVKYEGEKKRLVGFDEHIQTLNQLLVEMDGFDTYTTVLVIGATEQSDLLDPALLRSGRFDRHIRIDLPDKTDREAILQIHVRGKPLGADVGLSILASKSEGFSGADIKNWVNEAAVLATNRNKEAIYMRDFEDILRRMQTERLSGKVESRVPD